MTPTRESGSGDPSLPRQATVLVVDDEQQVRRLISAALSRAGYDVALAVDGHDALARIHEATPDLVVSDVMMPGLDGLSLVRSLRANPATRAIPVLLLTARGSTEDVVEGLGLGADDYLAKPFAMPELLARVRVKIERPPIPSDQLPHDPQTGLLSASAFRQELAREVGRAHRGGVPGCLAYLELHELPLLRERLGRRAEAEVARQATALVLSGARPLDLLGRMNGGGVALLLPETTPEACQRHLAALAQRLAGHTFTAAGEQARMTPTIGFARFGPGIDADQLSQRAATALTYAAAHLDLQPAAYDPRMDARLHGVVEDDPVVLRTAYESALDTYWHAPKDAADEERYLAVGRAYVTLKAAESLAPRKARRQALAGLRERLRLPAQLLLTQVLALGLPFALYATLATAGLDVTPAMYVVVVVALLVTALLIWFEGILALRRRDPPDPPSESYPPASAIIAAYLPNEAATIEATVEAFLRIQYPAPLQVILAYNTPRDLPVESSLHAIAARDPRFVPLRVAGSTSKAQNVNAALALVAGTFVGVFDADHHPDPDSFTRAWRWLASGYDVVQGHCLVRNGDESWVARLVAVEFEAIYAVSHPGRSRLHGFGVFGGSNGYWRTDLLRRTRMHGFMLTEDIDSSMRAVEAGHRIASDPYLVSRELAPLTLRALWNQRMRWAQGWFQVSIKHTWRGLRSRHLSPRQKLGFLHLLLWREVYPWISNQMLPIIAFWLWWYGPSRVDWLVPLFVATSLFTLSVGPGQAFFSFLLADPQVRRHQSWFLSYLVLTSLFYAPFKNLIAVVAQVKEVMRERAWKVTPRSAAAPRP